MCVPHNAHLINHMCFVQFLFELEKPPIPYIQHRMPNTYLLVQHFRINTAIILSKPKLQTHLEQNRYMTNCKWNFNAEKKSLKTKKRKIRMRRDYVDEPDLEESEVVSVSSIFLELGDAVRDECSDVRFGIGCL